MASALARRRGDAAKRAALLAAMGAATTYEAWSLAATRLDALDGLDPRDAAARWARETSLYDRRLLKSRTAHLRAVRAGGDVPEMAFALRTDLLRNLGNMAAPALHEHFHVVPEPIREYIDEVKRQQTEYGA